MPSSEVLGKMYGSIPCRSSPILNATLDDRTEVRSRSCDRPAKLRMLQGPDSPRQVRERLLRLGRSVHMIAPHTILHDTYLNGVRHVLLVLKQRRVPFASFRPHLSPKHANLALGRYKAGSVTASARSIEFRTENLAPSI